MYNRTAIIGANGYIARNLLYYINNHSPEIVIDSYDIAEEQVDGYDNYKSVNLLDANLEGEINYEVDDHETLHIVGIGTKNFYTLQSGF